MFEPVSNSVAHCINPDCQRPVVRSLAADVCPTCKTTLRLSDRYIPLEQLSSNRYTATYLVYDLRAKTEAMLKVLIEPNPLALDRFQHTAKALSSMRCPGLPRVTVKNYFLVPLRGSVHTVPCFVMELIQGKSLLEVIGEYPKGCPEPWVMGWLKQMVEALQFLHNRQFVHSNLTPDNILLRDDKDQVVLIGFGNPKSALGSGPGSELRSPTHPHPYKPPDQIAGMEPDPTVDLFALGRICIHLLTGIHPFDFDVEKTGQLRWQHRARVSPRFAELLDQLTHPSPAARPKNLNEVKLVLMELTTPKQKPKRQRQVAQPARRRSRVRKPKAHEPVTVMQDVRMDSMPMPALTDVIMLLVQLMANIAIVSAIFTAISCWLLFFSPITEEIQQILSNLSRSLPLVVSPPLALFMMVGIGTTWGLLNLNGGRTGHFWIASTLGSIGYGLSWLSWQGAELARPSQTFARMAAIASLFLAVGLCSKRYWWVQILVTALGTSFTLSTLTRLNVFRLADLYTLFAANGSVPAGFDLSLLITSAIFFASLGAAICFWFHLSELVAIPLVRGLMGQRD